MVLDTRNCRTSGWMHEYKLEVRQSDKKWQIIFGGLTVVISTNFLYYT